MELNRSVWYVRLFFWSLGIWEAFRDDDYSYDRSHVEERGTNLCFFIRVMVVYMPLVLLLHAAFAAAAVASLTALPIYLFGGITYGWTLAAIAVVVGTIWGVKVALRRAARRERTQVKFVERKSEVRSATEATAEPRPRILRGSLGVPCRGEEEGLSLDRVSRSEGGASMREFILPPKGLFAVLVVIAFIVGVQFGIVAGVQTWTKVAEGPCAFKSWSKSGPDVRLNLDCSGTEAWTEDAEVILGYLAKPGPLTCSLWASGKASCEVPK